MLRQQQHVTRARSEIGHGDRKDRQPVVEVFAELPLGHHLLKVAACRRDEPHIRADLLVGANARKGPLLKKAQQLHLQRYREVADLVKEQRAAICGLGAADPAFAGVGERPLLMSEQLGLDQCLR